ncbi:MAG: adenylate/guanylate cyclase domain-containing protein, partial [Proteobacteria bacterium]
IDAMFSLQNMESTEEGRKALVRLKAIKTPIYTGVYASNSSIEGRVPLDLDKPAYGIASYIDPNNRIPGTEQEQIDKLPMGDYRKSTIYGSHASLRSVFNHAGHILYGNDEGSYFPFLRLKDNKTVPQIMLMPFDDVLFQQNRLIVNGGEIPLNADGSAPVNYLGVQKITEKVNSIYKLTLPENAKARLATVVPGDFVFIIPLFYTGNVDFKPTPVGLVPGAFLHASVLNSILQKSQLQNMEIEGILILGFAAAVAYFGWWMGPSTLVLALIAVSGTWIATCIASFSYKGMILPFLLPQTAIVGVGVSLLLQRIYIAERKARMIRSTLEGVVRPEALKMLQRNPEKLSLQARERVVTVVFIDIVGFSLMVENQLPRVAFEGLQHLVESMTTVIHKHGGIVNKTLGDGILCFFGYSLEDNKEIGNHAEEALAAAL